MLNDYAYTLKILRSSAGAIMCGFIAYFFATEYGSGLESSTQYGLSFLAGMAWVLAEIVDTTVNNGVRKHRKFNHIDKVYIKTHNYNGIGISVPSEKTVERVNKKIDSRESKLVFINSLPISFGLPIAAAIAFTGYVRDIVPPNSDNFLTAIFLVSASVAVSIPYLLAVLTDMKLSSSIINATNGESEGEKTYYIFERSEEHTSELQSRFDLVCRLLHVLFILTLHSFPTRRSSDLYVRDIVPPNSDNFLTAIFLVSASVAVSIPYLLAVLTDMKLSSSIINATNGESEGEKTYYIFE